MKLTANERLTVISLLAGPRTLDGVIRFVDASPEHMAKTLVPNLAHHHVLRRIPNPDSSMPIYELNHDSIDVKRVINTTETR